jgi:hypothetical protein
MKRITILSLLCCLTMGLKAQAPEGTAESGTNFGSRLDAKNTSSVHDLNILLGGKDTANVKVIGKVTDVCHARGCFIYLESKMGNIYVKTKDDAFFVPLALNGKNVIVQGIAGRENDHYYILAKGILVL